MINGNGQKRVSVVFYRTESGNEPVRAWLKDLPDDDRKIIGDDLQTLEIRMAYRNALMPFH